MVWRYTGQFMTETESNKKTKPPENEAFFVPEGMTTDYITGKPVKESEKEKIRQEVARALIFEYQIAPESMQAKYPSSSYWILRSPLCAWCSASAMWCGR